TYSQPRGSRWALAQHFAAPTSSTRIPGRTYRVRSASNEYAFAFQTGSSQPTDGSFASTSSSGRYQPSLRAFTTQPSISRRFAAIPGRDSSSSRGIPSSTAYSRLQPVQRSGPEPCSGERQTGQRSSSRSAVVTGGTAV